MSAPVLAGGAVLALAGLSVSLKKLQPVEIPKTAMLCAVFFVASLIHLPLGPTSAHLVLAGLLGAILGWGVFVAVFTALLLQGVLFQFGGLTTLGVNTFNMAAPALLLYLLLGRFLNSSNRGLSACAAFLIGSLSLLGSAFLTALSLWLSGEHFLSTAQVLFAAHLPIAAVEGIVTLACVQFLLAVKPEVLPSRT